MTGLGQGLGSEQRPRPGLREGTWAGEEQETLARPGGVTKEGRRVGVQELELEPRGENTGAELRAAHRASEGGPTPGPRWLKAM